MKGIEEQKAYKFYHSLSKNEKKDLKKVANNESRKTFVSILKIFERKAIKRDPLDDRKIVFEKIFNEVYSRKKDNKLRNELRLLTKFIESELVRKELEKTVDENSGFKDLYLLKAFARRNRFDLVAKLAPLKIAQVEHKYLFHLAAEMEQIRFLDHSVHRSTRKANLAKGVDALKRRKFLLDQFHLRESRIIRSQVAFSQLTVSNTLNFIEGFPEEPHYSPLEIESPISRYFKLKCKIYLEPSGPGKIALLDEAIPLMEIIVEANKDFLSEKEFCVLTMALENFLKAEYSEAEKYYRTYFATFKSETKTYLAALINFANNQMKLNKFDEVSQMLESHERNFVKEEKLLMFFKVIQSSSYIRTNNAEKLRQNLPQNLSGLPRNFNYYYRLAFCILYYLEDQTELAIQEAQNLIRMIRGDKQLKPYVQMTTFFIRFFDWHESVKDLKDLRNIKEEIEEGVQSMDPEYRDYNPFLWLRSEVDNCLNSIGN